LQLIFQNLCDHGGSSGWLLRSSLRFIVSRMFGSLSLKHPQFSPYSSASLLRSLVRDRLRHSCQIDRQEYGLSVSCGRESSGQRGAVAALADWELEENALLRRNEQ
jgi:hypothetical protein